MKTTFWLPLLALAVAGCTLGRTGAPPEPTTASFTSRGAYSKTSGSPPNTAHSAAPRACPSLRALSALRCMNTRSIATSRGAYSRISALTPS